MVNQMSNTETSILEQLTTGDNLEPARQRLRNKIKQDLSAAIPSIMHLAKKSVLKNDDLSDQERILHETAMHYEKSRDSDVKSNIKSFSEWNSEQ
jgi:hypothetical protein